MKMKEIGPRGTSLAPFPPPHGFANDLENEHREEVRHPVYVETDTGQ